RTELCDPIQQISGGRGGPYVEVDEIAVQGRLHGGANTFLLPPDPQLTVGGGPEQQDTQLLRLRRPYRADDIVHGGLVPGQSRVQRGTISCGTAVGLLLIPTPLAFRCRVF